MKIKVIKARYDTYWYADKIGEIFKTKGIDIGMSAQFGEDNYYVVTKDIHGWIEKEDCEVVTEK